MDAVFRIGASEFNSELFHRIQSLLKEIKDGEVTIAVRSKQDAAIEDASNFWVKMDESIKDLKEGKGKQYTMEEFQRFLNEPDNK